MFCKFSNGIGRPFHRSDQSAKGNTLVGVRIDGDLFPKWRLEHRTLTTLIVGLLQARRRDQA